MEIPPDAIGFAIAVGTLLGAAFGIKFLVWGRGPIRRLRRGGSDPDLDERVVELEERVQQLSGLVLDQTHALEDYHERLDFTERVLTKPVDGEPKALDPPGDASS